MSKIDAYPMFGIMIETLTNKLQVNPDIYNALTVEQKTELDKIHNMLDNARDSLQKLCNMYNTSRLESEELIIANALSDVGNIITKHLNQRDNILKNVPGYYH